MEWSQLLFALSLTFPAILCPVAGHPGEHHNADVMQMEIAKRDAYADHIANGLANCAGRPSFDRLMMRTNNRLAMKAEALRLERGISAHKPYLVSRDLTALEEFETYKHNETSKGFSKSTKPKKLFNLFKNVSCILTPEVTQGPYWVTGEYIRSNVREKQKGVHLHLEYQYIDVSTCDVVPNLHIETWQANATGVYSGVHASGNGNYADTANINKTFLRGFQETDSDGVAAFDTVFPGHYTGRANHIHLIAHHGGKVLKNNTFTGGNISHVGQVFFPENLRAAVEANSPYTSNTQTLTTNDEDMWAPAQADNSYDPFPYYAYLGNSISDGLLMWISIGIDLTASYDPTAVGKLTKNGGVAAANGGGFGAASVSGGIPSGSNSAFQTGSMGSPQTSSTPTFSSSSKSTSTST